MRSASIIICGLLALCARHATAQLFGISADGALVSINQSTAASTPVGTGTYPALNSPGSLEWDPTHGAFLTLTVGNFPSLYRVNRLTGASTLVGPTGFQFVFEGGLQFSPDGILYATNGTNAASAQLLSVNPSTGAASIIGTMNSSTITPIDINGLAWRSDGVLIGLDRPSNSLVIINPDTAAVTALAPLTATVGNVGGMTNAVGNLGYFVNGSNELYSFDLFSGAATLVGTIPGSNITGLAYIPVPAPAAASMVMLAAGLMRRRTRPTGN